MKKATLVFLLTAVLLMASSCDFIYSLLGLDTVTISGTITVD